MAESSSMACHSPDAVEVADLAASWRSVYIHVPFCTRRCPYCDFAVVAADEAGGSDTARYVDALIAEMDLEPARFPLDAVNVGGGTPTRLSIPELARIVGAVETGFGIAPDAEVSIEANPEDWSKEYGTDLRRIGFNRVSFGIQSFDPVVLRALGRVHSPERAVRAVADARSVGFRTVNIDLIYGTPAESSGSWAATVETAISVEPDHLSAYALTVEGGTDLSRSVLAGAPGPDPDVQADRYEHLDQAIGDAGRARYEVSNWAARGHECRYNLSTWMMGEFAAFGTGAHDHIGGTRSRNIRRLDAYLEHVERGERPRSGSEHLDGFESERERFMVGLRLVAGVTLGAIGAAFLASEQGRRLAEAGVIDVVGERVFVRRPLLTDLVARSVLSVSPDDC